MSLKNLWFGCALLFGLSSAALASDAKEAAADSSESSSVYMPSMMDGFAHFLEYYLIDPVTGDSLSSRTIEFVVVNGEVDPPHVESDDRVQDLAQHFNSQRERDYMNENPGLIQALVNIKVERVNPEDTVVQLWEKIILRVYNNDDKEKATHYIDSAVWETQAGFWEVKPDLVPMGEWQEYKQH